MMLFCMFLSLVASAFHSQATIHMVYPGQSMQSAIDTSEAGDTILVHDGTYTETVILYGKSVTVASEYLLDPDTAHIVNTVVLPDSEHADTSSCFVYAYGEGVTSELVGFTLRDGRGTHWVDATFRVGGAIYVRGATTTIRHCRLVGGSAVYGGGLAAVEDALSDSTHCRIEDCMVDSCSAASAGGGIYSFRSSVELRRSRLASNSAGSYGGAVYASARQVLIDSCQFESNYGEPGGVWVSEGVYSISGSRFLNNASSGQAATHLLAIACDAVVTRCIFETNGTPDPAVMLNEYEPEHTIDFVGNIVRDCVTLSWGGPLTVISCRNGEIAFNILRDNVNHWAGALSLAINDTSPRIRHNAFLHNTAPDSIASAINVPRQTVLVADSNIFVGNSGAAVGTWYQYQLVYPPHVERNWWGDPSGPYHPTMNPTGLGDTILQDNVLFIPWLTEPPDTTMPDNYLSVRERPEVARTWVLMNAYPNPFNQSVTLVLAGFTGQDFEIGLYNLLGQMVDVVHRGALTGGQLHYQAPLWLASGVYLLSARDKHGIQTKKVILMK